MGQSTSIMLLPAQSGKTRKATELMNKWNKILETDGSMGHHHINIVFTSNNKLLSRQTSQRIDASCDTSPRGASLRGGKADQEFNGIEYDVPETTTHPKTLLWISGGKKPKSEENIYFDIRHRGLENIICCTNKVRIERTITLINYLYADRHTPDMEGRTVNIWIDEADACMNLWTKHIGDIARWGDFVNKVVLVSATMGPVIKHFDESGIPFNLRVFRNTHADIYVKFLDCEVHHEYSSNHRQSPLVHLRSVLDHAEVCAGSRWFCPGAINRKSHEAIMGELLSRGFNVLILNGQQKQLVFSQERQTPPINIMESVVEDGLELSVAIRKLYYEHRLHEQPFAVTGNLCVGRGITFASKEGDEEFLFTHGIIPDISSPEDLYQMVARCLGNFLHFNSFVPCKLYMNESVASKIRNQEYLAVELARRYFKDNDEEIVTITLQEYLEISQESPTKRSCKKKVSRPQERVPIIIPFGPEQTYLYGLTEGNKIRREQVISDLRSMIHGKPVYAKLLALINHPDTKLYATAPDADIAYQREITDVVGAATRGNTFAISIKKDERNKDKCSVMVDKREKRLCIVIWSVSGIY